MDKYIDIDVVKYIYMDLIFIWIYINIDGYIDSDRDREKHN